MTIEKRTQLISQNLDEVIGLGEIAQFFEKGVPLRHYIGFEISGMIHLGSGLGSLLKIKDLQEAGVATSIFLADWHTWINRKLGGADLDTIKKIAVRFFKEGMIAAAKCVGADPEKINFVLGSDLYHHNDAYWQTVVAVSKSTTLARMLRSITITGRSEGDSVDFALLLYPAMQVADIFIQGISFAHAGMDQRKAHVIMRDVAGSVVSQNAGLQEHNLKPVALHQHLILGLGKPPAWPLPADIDRQELFASLKMSKSKPDSAVFLTDAPEEIERKIMKAFCAEGDLSFNPILDWAKHLVMRIEHGLEIHRPEQHGGNVSYDSYEVLEADFVEKKIHPTDLKAAVAKSLIRILEPARNHFSDPARAEMEREMRALIQKK